MYITYLTDRGTTVVRALDPPCVSTEGTKQGRDENKARREFKEVQNTKERTEPRAKSQLEGLWPARTKTYPGRY